MNNETLLEKIHVKNKAYLKDVVYWIIWWLFILTIVVYAAPANLNGWDILTSTNWNSLVNSVNNVKIECTTVLWNKWPFWFYQNDWAYVVYKASSTASCGSSYELVSCWADRVSRVEILLKHVRVAGYPVNTETTDDNVCKTETKVRGTQAVMSTLYPNTATFIQSYAKCCRVVK